MAATGFSDLEDLACDAYIWGIPLVQTRLYLQLARELGLPFNQLYGSPRLSTPDSKVPLPNVDTLYGLGWLDLSNEPQVLNVPDTHDRYYLIQLNDAYLNSFSYIGRRTTGTRAASFAIVGPNWRGSLPDRVTPVVAPTNHVLVLTRVLVVDEDDLAEAHAVQSQLSLTPLSAFPYIKHPNKPIEDAFDNFPILQPAKLGAAYFDELCAGLEENPPPPQDRKFLALLEELGIGPGKSPGKAATLERRRMLESAVERGHQLIHSRGGWLIDTREVNGWRVSYGITSFIRDPLDRAVVAKLGPGCLVPEEGLYFSMQTGPDGQSLHGDRDYVLHFPPGELPPVDAFWSLTLYDGEFRLVPNPINRYAIGDRTAGLRLEHDGSLRVAIQATAPADGTSNWLPTPAGRPFHLFLRTYQPQAGLLSGAYRMPALAFANQAP